MAVARGLSWWKGLEGWARISWVICTRILRGLKLARTTGVSVLSQSHLRLLFAHLLNRIFLFFPTNLPKFPFYFPFPFLPTTPFSKPLSQSIQSSKHHLPNFPEKMAENNPNSFADFPEDVQFCVLSFLTPTEIANFACTSKRFAPLCQNDSKLWYSLCDRRWGSKTRITKWGNGKISYKLLYKTLNKWENFIGFWRRCGRSQQKENVKPPALVFFEWGPSFLSGSRVSPSQNGTCCVTKTPFLWMGISPEGQIVNHLNPEGQNEHKLWGESGFLEMDLVPVNVNFIGDLHFSVEENVNFVYRRSSSSGNLKGDDNGEDVVNVESGSPGSLPETLEIYQYYANRTSPVAERALRRQRRREKEKLGRKRWETEHFSKIVDSSPTTDRPLQGLWKGICEERKLEFYLVTYDGAGISCRRVGGLSEGIASSIPVFWTSNPTFIDSPFPIEEEHIYNSRIHFRPPGDPDLKCALDNDVVSRIMYINSSYDLVIPGLAGASVNPWRVEGRIWQYRNGSFGFGFLRDHFIVDLKQIAQNGCLLDTLETCSD